MKVSVYCSGIDFDMYVGLYIGSDIMSYRIIDVFETCSSAFNHYMYTCISTLIYNITYTFVYMVCMCMCQ